ncbi:hypothetical protein ABID42_001616 [Arcicella rosea]|uniref:hypothetical protein n=1 Tax=Arcicella rosea TaxID=502909 RepID=UPI00345D2424
MTEEAKSQLQNNIERRLNELTSDIDDLNRQYSILETCRKSINCTDDVYFENLQNLLNFRLIVGIINLDLCAAILIHLRAKFQYESIYSSRQIIIIICEGYKKLYNFIIEKDNGDKVSKYRNNSFWIKEVGTVVHEILPEYQSQYDLITQQLDNYLSVNFETLKVQRDLSIHYDKEPIKVYEMLSNLDIEETLKTMIPFLAILNSMFSFIFEITKGFEQKTKLEIKNQELRILEIINLINKFKTEQNEKMIEDAVEQIFSSKKNIDNIQF